MTRYAPVEPLTPEHDSSTFDCGSTAQTEWLRRYALLAQQADTSRVYDIRPNGEQRVAGYYALSAGSIEPPAAPRRLAAGVGRHPIPVIVLTRLGVDRRDQHRGLGRELVYDAFLQAVAAGTRIGARALLINAESEAAKAFYLRIDRAFETSPTDELDVVLLMKDLRKAIRKVADIWPA